MSDSIPSTAGTPCWIEIPATDVVRAKKFYSAAFNWSFRPSGAEWPEDKMAFFSPPDKHSSPGGGIHKVDEHCHLRGQGGLTIYLAANELETAMQAVEKSGGKKVDEPKPVGAMGMIQHFEDSEGNYIGMYQEKKE